MEYLETCLNLDQIKEAQINQFTKLEEESIKDKSFEYLIGEKNKMIKYQVQVPQYPEYLKSKDVSI